MNRRWAMFVALATIVAYAPAFRNGFVWDDSTDVVQNPALADLAGLKSL